FYLDATTEGYAHHYRMYSYVLHEITSIVRDHFRVPDISLMGHSMGGHGALVLGLRHPSLFKSITAFAPIVNPSHVPWGVKAFTGYLGPRGTERETTTHHWASYDACELLKSGHRHPGTIRIFQGGSDEFLGEQLQPEVFCQLAREVGQDHKLTWCEGYDHSYYFVQSFLPEAVAPIVNKINH
ncbi:MAG: S-formylglutathione hydrolase, partial [Deltaproteobacteria bacterium]|nr:S-formylglutathione hydrolase [Deltaproteobacteria bacterium]